MEITESIFHRFWGGGVGQTIYFGLVMKELDLVSVGWFLTFKPWRIDLCWNQRDIPGRANTKNASTINNSLSYYGRAKTKNASTIKLS